VAGPFSPWVGRYGLSPTSTCAKPAVASARAPAALALGTASPASKPCPDQTALLLQEIAAPNARVPTAASARRRALAGAGPLRLRGCGHDFALSGAAPAGSAAAPKPWLDWPDPSACQPSRQGLVGPRGKGGCWARARFASGRPLQPSLSADGPISAPLIRSERMPLQVGPAGGGLSGTRPGSGHAWRHRAFRRVAWWAEGLGVLDAQLKGVSLPKERSFRLRPWGSPWLPLQAALGQSPPARLLALWQPGALLTGLRQGHWPTRSTVSPSAWKRRLPRHRGRTAAAAGRMELAEPMGTSSCCCCAWAALDRGAAGVWAWRSARLCT